MLKWQIRFAGGMVSQTFIKRFNPFSDFRKEAG